MISYTMFINIPPTMHVDPASTYSKMSYLRQRVLPTLPIPFDIDTLKIRA